MLKVRKFVVAAAAVAGMGLVSASAAFAGGTTFAQFHELTSGNSNLFSYTESGVAGAGGTATLGANSIPVTFSYESTAGLPSDLQGNQDAMLSLQAVTVNPVISLAGVTDAQGFTPPTSSGYLLTITRDTPATEGAGGMTNLLSVLFNSGTLLAQPGSSIASFSASNLTYFSDFLNFTTPASNNLGLAFSSWTSTSDGGNVEVDAISNFFASATAAGAGTFDASVIPTTNNGTPEPASASLMIVAGGMLCGRRRAK